MPGKEIPRRDIEVDFCVECGGPVQRVRLEDWQRPTKPEVVIHDVECFECQDCKERYLNPVQIRDVESKTNEALRKAQHLLVSSEIQAILDRLQASGFNISKLAECMGVTRQEIHRWVNAERVQSPMADVFLRYIAAQPAQFADFIREQGINLSVQKGRPKKVG